MRLLLAMSADGFLATGPVDDMSWTGRDDKAVFRLLTMSSSSPLIAGSKTYDQLPPLKGREVIRLSQGDHGIRLRDAAKDWPDGWLIGGPTVAELAVWHGLIDRAFICVSQSVNLHAGISSKILMELLEVQLTNRTEIKFGSTNVHIYTKR